MKNNYLHAYGRSSKLNRDHDSIYWMILLTFLGIFFLNFQSSAQVGPNCTHINASIGFDDTARVTVAELVTNIDAIAAQGDSVNIEITGEYGQRIFYVENVGPTYEIALHACRYLGRQLKVNVTIFGGGGSCWSYLTFKQGNAPVIIGRSKTVYCFDPLVQGGHIHGIPPLAMVPCRGTEDATFVADWIDARACIADSLGTAGNDTAKIILREYEAYDKEGRRGSGFDTIIVVRLPQITVDNAFCPERDTVYCGTGGKLGPYMVVGRTFQYGDTMMMGANADIDRYQAVSFVRTEYNESTGQLEFYANEFDPKCGIAVHVDAWPLSQGECVSQYKVNVEVKQSCYGTPGLYTMLGASNINDFVDTYHPKHWDYSRNSSLGSINYGVTNVGALTSAFNGTTNNLNPDIKLINNMGAMDVTLASGAGSGEYARMCINVPQDGDFTFTIVSNTDAMNGGYRLNGDFVPMAAGTYTLSLEACDEICFDVRGTTSGGVETSTTMMVNGLMWVETAIAAPLDSIAPGYWRCEFWVVDLDTLPPIVECEPEAKVTNEDLLLGPNQDTLLIPAGSHDCASHSYVPPVRVEDDWSGVKYVKVIIPGISTVVMERSAEDPDLFESHKQVKIPHGPTMPIYYEAYDSCHNLGRDTCWVKVKDLTKPVAVCDKGVTVSLSGKKVWVDAYTFDEGSWDNCEINLLLARRADWWDACVDLCDSFHVACYSDDEYHHDTLWCADLEEDKHKDEVEAHYYKTMKWLKEDQRECSDILWNAWKYDLCKKYMLECIDHPYDFDEHEFKRLFKELNCVEEFEGITTITDELIDQWDQIGGGWSDAVPFDCDDACEEVVVELLAMDYWCNWSRCWTYVLVEDKTPIQIVHDVQDKEISCAGYKDDIYEYPNVIHPVSIEWIIDAAKEGDEVALAKLDEIFGGYQKVWRDEYGNVPEVDTAYFYDQECICSTFVKQEKVYDDHLGYIWKEYEYDSCWVDTVHHEAYYGQVVVNCAQAIQCEQEVWCEFDHCGQGYVFRKWKFIQGCPPDENGHYSTPQNHKDTITRKQLIWVGNNCELQKGMFYKPHEKTVYTCGIEYDEAGNAIGALHPDSVGKPEYMFDDDCRIVGIGHTDKVFKVVGGDEACYKVIRTWHFIDWCYLDKPADDIAYWWLDPYYEGKTFDWEQKIIVQDTVPPVCTFEEELEEVEAAGCAYTLRQTVNVSDPCGTLSYYWELNELKGDEETLVDSDEGELDGISDNFEIEVADLLTGDYILKVRVTDECQNESYCIDEFSVITGKKPSAICITSLTAELTPMDLDQDGTIDTAMVTIWANEFDRSSAPACDSEDEISFYIELMDGIDDTTFVEDADSLVVGCEHVGTQTIRLWVVDEKGSFDFCDVLLVVQNNMGGCENDEVVVDDMGTVLGSIVTEEGKTVEQVEVEVVVESRNVQASMLTGSDGTYNFDVPMGEIIHVTPSKDIAPNNGVSTMDLILLQKHIIGMEPLGSPYRMIAADVNRDGFVNALDLLEVRQMVLREIDAFANSESWRFVLANHQFASDQPQAENFPERLVTNMNQQEMQSDFIGIKIADLDLNGDPKLRGRSADDLQIVVSDVDLAVGEVVEVPFTISEAKQVIGYQFTIQVDPEVLEMISVTPVAFDMSAANFGIQRTRDGLISTSWNGNAATDIKDELLFSVKVRAKNQVKLSNALTIGDRLTPAASYSSQGTRSVGLNFQSEDVVRYFYLGQNEPNPVTDETIIRFALPSAGSANLNFYDVTGKLIKQITGNYSKGLNKVNISAKTLGLQGMIYYELEMGDQRQSRKMIIH